MAIKPLNSAGGFSVGDYNITTVIYPNTDVTTANLLVGNYANLGDVANIYIGGGTTGAVLSTDGSGTLSWSSAPSVTEIHNGNSNVQIPTLDGPVYINANNGTDHQWAFDNQSQFVLPDNGGYITAANGAQIDIYTSGQNYSEIYLNDAGNVTITTWGEQYNWYFDTNGNLTTPGNVNIPSSSQLDFRGTDTNWRVGYDIGTPWTKNITGANTTLDIEIGNGSGDGFTIGNNGGNSLFEIDSTSGNVWFSGNIQLNGKYINDYQNQGIELYSSGNYAALDYNGINYVWADANGAFMQAGAAYANLWQGNGVFEINGSELLIDGSGGDITMTGGNILGANVVYANSFTSNGGVVDFSTNNANVQLGDVSNVHILGGNVGAVLATDGNGNLSWTDAPSVTEIHNGNSNVTIPTADGPVYINANSGTDYQWQFDTSGNLYMPGAYIANGNAGLQLIDSDAVYLTPNIYADNSGLYMVNGGDSELYAAANVTIWSNIGPTEYEWIFDTTGNLVLPSQNATITTTNNSPISIKTNGTNYSQVFVQDGGNIDLSTNGGAHTLSLDSDGNLWTPGNVYLGTDNVNNPVSLVDENSQGIQLYSANYTQLNYQNTNYLWVDGGGTYIENGSGSYQWQFDTNGNLNLPNGASGYSVINSGSNSMNITTGSGVDIILNNGADILLYTNGQLNGWTFGSDGNLIVQNDIYPASSNVSNLGNTTSWWSNIYVANATLSNISAENVQVNSISSTQIAYANGSSYLVGNASFTFDDTSSNLSVGGNIIVGTGSGGNISGVDYLLAQYANLDYDLNASGNVLANAITSNTNVTVNGNVYSNAIYSQSGSALTIGSSYSNVGSYNINLVPAGSGNVDVNSTYITSLHDPLNPQDAATKQYVDSVSQGLYIHTAANVQSYGNLNATYSLGGISLTVTDIINGNTIQFSTNHGLSVNDDIEFTNSFNGLNGSPDEYFVDTIPALNQITLRETYFGPLVTGLTNGSGLSQPALAEGGVGATLTNAGTQAALTIDSISMTVGARVLVTGQTNEYENGIYDVTTVGDGSTNWVLTRSSDGNQYRPKDSSALCDGSYWFITQGATAAGSSWVLSSPTGEINIGTDNIVFTQFSKAGSYTAGNGIAITGTVISANVDNITTAISAGNIVVKASAQLTTPNIGDATGSSLNLNGDLTAGGLAELGTDVGQGAPYLANVLSNATVAMSGAGGNWLTFGQYDSSLNYAAWIQSSYQNAGTAAYNIILNPLGGNVGVGGNTAPTTAISVEGDAYVSNSVMIGETTIGQSSNVSTASIAINQPIATIPVAGITGIEFFVKGIDASGAKYSAATVQALTDGSNVDFVIYGTTFIGAATGTLSVGIANSNVILQVTPSSSNTTTWTTQYRLI